MTEFNYLHVLGNTRCFSGSIVVTDEFGLGENLERGITTDRVFVTGLLSSLRTIDLGQRDRRIASSQELRSFRVFGL